MPVLNEHATIKTAIEEVLELGDVFHLQLIVIDSGSTDGTRDILKSMAIKSPFDIIYERNPRGKGLAVRKGIETAIGEIISIVDADNEYEIRDLIKLIEHMTSRNLRSVLGNRHVQGRKMRDFSDETVKTYYYNFGHYFFTYLFNMLYRTKFKDPATMWKVFYRRDIEGYKFIGRRFEFDWELLSLLVRRGYIPDEVNVNYKSRSHKDGKKVRSFKDPIIWLFSIIYFRFRGLN